MKGVGEHWSIATCHRGFHSSVASIEQSEKLQSPQGQLIPSSFWPMLANPRTASGKKTTSNLLRSDSQEALPMSEDGRS